MSDPVNTATHIAEVSPVPEVPPKDTVSEPAVNATTRTAATATGVNATGPKVTPIQRLSTVYSKAKQTVSDAVAEANKAISEKKTAKSNTIHAAHEETTAEVPPTHISAAETTEPVVTSEATTQDKKKAGTSSIAFRDLLARVKGLARQASTHPAPAEATSNGEATTAPTPPPKDNDIHHNTHPVIDQLKRNSTLLANYFTQKKKDFTKKSSDETHNNEQHSTFATTTTTTAAAAATPKVYDTNEEKTSVASSPLVLRITKLVHTATATISKKKDQHTKNEPHATVTDTTNAANSTVATPAGAAVAPEPATTTVA